jgi:hypothetical protein
MAILFADGFDYFNSNTYVQKIWNADAYMNNFQGFGYGVYGEGRAAMIQGTDQIYKSGLGNLGTCITAFHINLNGQTGQNPLVRFNDGSTNQVYLYRTTAGQLEVKNGNGTTLGTSTTKLSTNTWYWISMKVVFGNTGSVSVKVNETTVINVSSVDTTNTANNYCNRVGYGTASNSNVTYFDTFYIMDSTGASYNDHIPEHRLRILLPNADGSLIDFTAVGLANRWACVSDNAAVWPDDDYITSDTNGHYYTMAARNSPDPNISGNISHVQINMIARQDAGSRTMALMNRQGSTNYDGASKTLSNSYDWFSEYSTINPATSNVWTSSEIPNTQFGVKVLT